MSNGVPPFIRASAPGRICLFGEHQDYLGLPVIAAAINLRVTVEGSARADRLFHLDLPDIGEEFTFDPNKEFAYRHDRDYLPAAANILRREGVKWTRGYDVTVRSAIPLNSGASSSSALQVAWVSFLLAAAGDERADNPADVARFAHRSEVTEFNSPGGMMDHYSTAVGGIIWLDTRPPYTYKPLPPWSGEFVLVDSAIPKDTNGVLGGIRHRVDSLRIDFHGIPMDQDVIPPELTNRIAPHDMHLLKANFINRRLTEEARLLMESPFDVRELGRLLNAHHNELIHLGTSHPAIDALLNEAVSHGSIGGKINGSGCGGSFFLLCPGRGEEMCSWFREKGYRAWVVQIGHGLEVSVNEPLEVAK